MHDQSPREGVRIGHSILCISCVLFIEWALFLPSVSQGQIAFFQDFDSGSLDVAATSVDYSSPSNPIITVAARDTGTWHSPRVYFQMTGVEGLRPEFQVTTVNRVDGHRHIFSYDQQNWDYFDNITEGTTWDTFGHNTPFTHDTVYVSHAIPYPMSRTDQLVASVRSNPWVSPTLSGDANLVLGQTLGTAGGGYYDDTGRVVPAQNLYGFKVTDPMGTPDRIHVVWNSGNHASELTGTLALEGSIDFITGNDPRAIALRRRVEIYVYPQCNPEGRYNGYHRGSPEVYGTDHNREWDKPEPFTDITIYENSMKADTGGDVDYFFDYHSSNSAEQMAAIWGLGGDLASDYVQALRVREPGLVTRNWNKVGAGQDFGRDPVYGLGAEYSLTPEIGIVDGATEEDYLNAGANYVLALFDILSPELGMPLGDMDGSGIIDPGDISPFYLARQDLPAYWNTYELSPEILGDMNHDGTFNGQDLLLLMAMLEIIPGDANLSGVVDDDDLSLLLANWNVGDEWGEGDLNASGNVDDDDLSLLLANWGAGSSLAPEAIPEPATLPLLAVGGLVMIRRRPR